MEYNNAMKICNNIYVNTHIYIVKKFNFLQMRRIKEPKS